MGVGDGKGEGWFCFELKYLCYIFFFYFFVVYNVRLIFVNVCYIYI